MPDIPVEPLARRHFLARLSSLGLIIPAAGSALASCSQGSPNGSDSAQRGAGSTTNQQLPRQAVHNPDSRLDTAHLTHPTTSVPPGAANTTYARYDPALPPLPRE